MTTPRTITLSEFRAKPGEHVSDVGRFGASFLITKNGKPIAKLVPIDDANDSTTIILGDGRIVGAEPIARGLRGAGY